MSLNKALLEHSHVESFMYLVWLFLPYSGRVERVHRLIQKSLLTPKLKVRFVLLGTASKVSFTAACLPIPTSLLLLFKLLGTPSCFAVLHRTLLPLLLCPSLLSILSPSLARHH